jgi:hypothetical protein
VSGVTMDLHGCEGHAFPGFDEEVGYLERVTVTDRAEAVREFRREWGFGPNDPEEVNPQPIHMRFVVAGDPELLERPIPDVPCWLECAEDHPDAIPFWKDSP